jgi:hypothetical protein
VRCVYDRHTFGLFARSEWLRLLSEVGFEARIMTLQHSQIRDRELEVFVGLKSSRH